MITILIILIFLMIAAAIFGAEPVFDVLMVVAVCVFALLCWRTR